MSSRVLFVACALLASSCTLSRPPPQAQAAAIQSQCSTEPPRAAQVVAPANVDRVEPLYAIVDSKPNGMEQHLIGAKLHFRLVDGVTTQEMARALACHAARDVLQGPQNESCPFAIPDAWVRIEVHPDETGYEVALRGYDFEEAEQIFTRARAFARN